MLRDIKVGDLVVLNKFIYDDESAGLVIAVDNRTIPTLLTVLVGNQRFITTQDEVSL